MVCGLNSACTKMLWGGLERARWGMAARGRTGRLGICHEPLWLTLSSHHYLSPMSGQICDCLKSSRLLSVMHAVTLESVSCLALVGRGG